MKSDFAKIVYCAAILAVGCAAEDLLPKFLGAGFPVLLAAAVFVSARSGVFSAVAFAIAAGAAEDAVSSLPVATSACFFTLAALFANSVRHLAAVALLAYPLYQLWLWIWLPGVGAGVFARIVAAVPLGAVAAAAVFAIMRSVERKAAIDA